MIKEKEQQPPRTRLDNHLAPQADKILAVLRKYGPRNDLELDPVFTRKVKSPERENVLRALEAANLIRCQPTGHGLRLWIPMKIKDADNKTNDKTKPKKTE